MSQNPAETAHRGEERKSIPIATLNLGLAFPPSLQVNRYSGSNVRRLLCTSPKPQNLVIGRLTREDSGIHYQEWNRHFLSRATNNLGFGLAARAMFKSEQMNADLITSYEATKESNAGKVISGIDIDDLNLFSDNETAEDEVLASPDKALNVPPALRELFSAIHMWSYWGGSLQE